MIVEKFLENLAIVVSSPYSFVAYIALIGAWSYVHAAQNRIKKITKVIKDLPEHERAKVLLKEYNTVPSRGINAKQWLRSRSQILKFSAYIAALVTIFAIVTVALNNSNSSSSEASPIPPLINAKNITGEAQNGLVVKRILEGQSKDPASRVYNIYLANNSEEQLLLSRIETKWQYEPGFTAIPTIGSVLEPVAKYIVELPIDVLDDSTHYKKDDVYPVVFISSRDEERSSLATLRLQVHYNLKQKRHPSSDWNIVFSIDLIDDNEGRTSIFSNYRWN